MKIKSKGFTLVELLLVIGLIATVIPMVFLIFNKYDKKNEMENFYQMKNSTIQFSHNEQYIELETLINNISQPTTTLSYVEVPSTRHSSAYKKIQIKVQIPESYRVNKEIYNIYMDFLVSTIKQNIPDDQLTIDDIKNIQDKIKLWSYNYQKEMENRT